jgi:inorganic pyrophosphatase
MNPWHDVSLGEKFPDEINVIIEIPKGSNAKYKLDAETGLIKLGEFLPTVARYPANYGFFPRTIAGDGDALDVFVFGREAVVPLTLMQIRVLGAVQTRSPKKGKEFKVIAVCPGDPEFEMFKTLKDLPNYYVDQLAQFFEEYKALEGDPKVVKDFLSPKKTIELIKDCAATYSKKLNKGKI